LRTTTDGVQGEWDDGKALMRAKKREWPSHCNKGRILVLLEEGGE